MEYRPPHQLKHRNATGSFLCIGHASGRPIRCFATRGREADSGLLSQPLFRILSQRRLNICHTLRAYSRLRALLLVPGHLRLHSGLGEKGGSGYTWESSLLFLCFPRVFTVAFLNQPSSRSLDLSQRGSPGDGPVTAGLWKLSVTVAWGSWSCVFWTFVDASPEVKGAPPRGCASLRPHMISPPPPMMLSLRHGSTFTREYIPPLSHRRSHTSFLDRVNPRGNRGRRPVVVSQLRWRRPMFHETVRYPGTGTRDSAGRRGRNHPTTTQGISPSRVQIPEHGPPIPPST